MYLKSSLKNQDQVFVYKYKYIIIAPRHQPIIVNHTSAPAASTTTHCKLKHFIPSTTNKIIVDKKSKNIILYNIREKLQAFHLTK